MPIMGATNLRRSLFPLHTEVKAFLWAMKCMIGADNQDVVFFTDCSDLVKMVSFPTEWPTFSVYLEKYRTTKNLQVFFIFNFLLCANVKTNNLIRKICIQPYHITYYICKQRFSKL